MAGFLDLVKVFNNPSNQEMFVKLPQFLNEWISFMRFLRGRIDSVDARLAEIDSKLVALPAMDFKLDRLLDPEPAVTPEIHAGVLEMASNDPRQGEVTDGRRAG